MTDTDGASTGRPIAIEGESRRFYEGVSTGIKIRDTWGEQFDKADKATRARVYWFYVGLLAAAESGLNAESRLDNFLAGASTRSPDSDPDDSPLPDDWPEELTDRQQDRLERLVTQTGREVTSRVNAQGVDEQVTFLLEREWSLADIQKELGIAQEEKADV